MAPAEGGRDMRLTKYYQRPGGDCNRVGYD